MFYAYPKDLTPGCTKEACGFRDVYKSLEEANIQVLDVSADSVKPAVHAAEVLADVAQMSAT